MIGTFSTDSLELVSELLFAEDLTGKCGQKKLREQNKQPRTPAQEAADQQRSQQRSQQNQSGSSTARSEAAKKGAETRRRCKGLTGPPQSQTV